MGEAYPDKSVDPFDYLSTFTVNLIMRCVGIFMRTVVIVVGMLATLLLILSYPIILLVWLILPFGVVVVFFIGFGLLFR